MDEAWFEKKKKKNLFIDCFTTILDLDGENLRHLPDALGATRTEEEPRARADEFWMLEEAEKNRSRVVGSDMLGCHDPF